MAEEKDEKVSKNSHTGRNKAKNFWGTLARLIGYMATRKWALLFVVIIAIVATLLQTVAPRILGQATTIIFDGVIGGFQNIGGEMRFDIDFAALTNVLVTVAILYLLSALFSFFQGFVLSRVTQRTIQDLRQDMREKLNRLPISYIDKTSHGEILSRAVNDIDNISMTLQQSVQQILTSTVQFFGALVMMFLISPTLTLVALVTIPLSIILMLFIAPRSQRLFGTQQKLMGEMNGLVEENFAGQLEIKSFNQEDNKIGEYAEKTIEFNDASWKAQYLSGIMMPVMNMIKNIGYVLVAVVGGVQVASGIIPIGDVQAMMQYTNTLSEPLKQTANMINQIQRMAASAERIFEYLDAEEMEHIEANIAPIDTDKKVIFDHVRFGYAPGEDNLIMHDFNLEVESGQMIAVVGPTGAGKSTLINLIERFYDISGGSIKIDGVDTRDYSRDEVRTNIGMVLQDTWLFNGSIYDNIAYGAYGDVSSEKVHEAAKAAHVDDFVRTLPDGYDTIVDQDASNFSQGQRQLITIARAFVSDPQILILDEATSSIDTRTELLIQRAMSRLLENRTSFVIAHRLSTIKDAHNIIVMNQGDVLETGSHDELMEQKGFYYNLYNSQYSGAADTA